MKLLNTGFCLIVQGEQKSKLLSEVTTQCSLKCQECSRKPTITDKYAKDIKRTKRKKVVVFWVCGFVRRVWLLEWDLFFR